ncbi:OLC1v1005266C2 [Oldenlandia corymbosa var. corymbosa]|uniref:OLC1v1005266C2 n=1 Tax=Oldenlandia corymbosa var. corymbosa TaxID=529605 RepID=A0AAV1DGY8_OLDCO|nr:OLC1v1005266C2 [Oldenlandia corymbosa var. corymbosa]
MAADFLPKSDHGRRIFQKMTPCQICSLPSTVRNPTGIKRDNPIITIPPEQLHTTTSSNSILLLHQEAQLREDCAECGLAWHSGARFS